MATTAMITGKIASIEYWTALRSGKKVAEGRADSERWNRGLLGQTVAFTCGDDRFSGVVWKINTYTGVNLRSAIYKMLLTEGVSNMLPGVSDLHVGVEIYLKYNAQSTSNTMHAIFIRDILM